MGHLRSKSRFPQGEGGGKRKRRDEEGEIDVQKKGQICKLKKGRIKLTIARSELSVRSPVTIQDKNSQQRKTVLR
jgi:hypothetical protein